MNTAFAYADLEDPQTIRFLEALLDRRNEKMAAGIEARLAANPDRSYFFAIGSLHMPGPEGILALLTKRGYTIERVRP